MTKDEFKWGALVALIVALSYVPTKRCGYIGGGEVCVATKWRFVFSFSGRDQVDLDRMIIQVIVAVIAIVGLWLFYFKDRASIVGTASESHDAQSQRAKKKSQFAVPDIRQAGTGSLIGKDFRSKKRSVPERMLGGAVILGCISIPFSIGLALFAPLQIGFLGYVFFVAFATAVGGIIGLMSGD